MVIVGRFVRVGTLGMARCAWAEGSSQALQRALDGNAMADDRDAT